MVKYSEVQGNMSYSSSYNTYETQTESGCNICGKDWLKTFLLFFNMIIWFMGIGLLGLGIYLLFNRESYASILAGELFYIGNYIIIIAGCLIFITATLGCVGIFRNWSGLLSAYACLLGCIMVMEVVGGVLAYAFSGLLQTLLLAQLKASMTSDYHHDPLVKSAVNTLQLRFRCCGAASYHDWTESPYAAWAKTTTGPQRDNRVPDSCCKSRSIGCGKSDHPSNINTVGCYAFLAQKLHTNLLIVGGAGLGIACLEIIGIIISCCLVKALKKGKDSPILMSKY